MISAIARRRPAHWRVRRHTLLMVMVAALLGGCAAVPASAPPSAAPEQASALQACQAWFNALDGQTDASGVRDAAAARVAGHAYLRVDRFTASLIDRLPAQPDAAGGQAAHDQWIERLLALDRKARQHELANLPSAAVRGLATRFDLADRPTMLAYTKVCGSLLADAQLGTPAQSTTLRQHLVVPDDYVDAYRVLGLYPLMRIPFLAGVRQFEEQTRKRFAAGAHAAVGEQRLRLWPPGSMATGAANGRDDPRAKPHTASGNALGVPMPTAEQAQWLFERHAPVFDLAIAGTDDQPGALTWDGTASDRPAPWPRVDVAQPVVYRQLAHTRAGETSLLQLVYTIWFGARTPGTAPIDLLAGRIDGLVWRVTLSPDGAPLVYDSIHPCGCYHLFFPAPGVMPRPAPADQAEWAFSPASAPALKADQRILLRVASASHYLEGIGVLDNTAASGASMSYQWRDYDALRALPMPGGSSRSVFGPDGFMPGTDRLESWLFWPMGIARAGAMRQWGHHATAFVGRRHFDDARLFEQRFDLGAALPGE